MSATVRQSNAIHNGTVDSEKIFGLNRPERPDFTDPKFSNFEQSSDTPAHPPLTITAIRALATEKARSKQSLSASEIRFIISSEPHYLVPLPKNLTSSSELYHYEPKERAYNPIRVDLSNFGDGERASFVAGLEVGRMSVLENQLVFGGVICGREICRGRADIGMDVEGTKVNEGVNIQGSHDGTQAALAYVLSKLSLADLPLPVSADTPHYIVTNSDDSSSGNPLWFIYDGVTQSYKHIQVNLCGFPYGDDVPFVAGVEVGRRSVLDYEFDVDRARIMKIMDDERFYEYYVSDDSDDYNFYDDEEEEDEMMGDDSWLTNQFYSDEERAKLRDKIEDFGEEWVVV